MRKVATILLMFVMMFNLAGYHLFFNYLQSNQAKQLDSELYSPQNVNIENLRAVKVPVTFPYYTNHKSFEPASGEINVNGTVYKVVKKRIYNDSLEIVYIIDVDKMKIQHAKNDFVKQAVANTNTGEKRSSKPVKPVIVEYTITAAPITALVFPLSEKAIYPNEDDVALLQNTGQVDHPPEALIA